MSIKNGGQEENRIFLKTSGLCHAFLYPRLFKKPACKDITAAFTLEYRNPGTRSDITHIHILFLLCLWYTPYARGLQKTMPGMKLFLHRNQLFFVLFYMVWILSFKKKLFVFKKVFERQSKGERFPCAGSLPNACHDWAQAGLRSEQLAAHCRWQESDHLSHHHHVVESALAGNWSQNGELNTESRNMNVKCRYLSHRLSACFCCSFFFVNS